jgi:two-component system OmpR family response regulator
MRTIMGDKLKALIVDDEIDVCYLLTAILNCKNLKASYVNSINEAKRVLLEENPSIVFLDNHLPDGFGITFIEEIKKLNPSAKIVMITAYDTSADRDTAYHRGVDYFIGKPFTREIIFKTVENLLN